MVESWGIRWKMLWGYCWVSQMGDDCWEGKWVAAMEYSKREVATES
jgi:hypothetical protein